MKRKQNFTIFKSVALYSCKEREDAEHYAKMNLLENDYDNVIEEVTDEMITNELYREEEFDYDCEKDNLNKVLNGKVIAIVDVGLWNGRRHGIKVLSNNLNSIMNYFGCDYANIYATRRGVYGEFYHHDGTHYVEFRELKNENIYDENDVKFDTENRNSITRHTKSLAPYVRDIYGCLT